MLLNIGFLTIILFAFKASLISTSENCTESESKEENLKRLVIANNDLALRLYQRLSSDSEDNIFFSPFSLSTIFGMLFYGTKGKTAEQLRTALGYNAVCLPSELVHDSFNQILSEQPLENSTNTFDYANAIVLDKSLQIIPSFKSEVENLYKVHVQEVDFSKDTNNIVDDINKWIEEKTNGNVQKFLNELDSSTLMILLNAMYFKGTWEIQFNKHSTIEKDFYNNGSKTEKVQMMHVKSTFPYTDDNDLKALELPYTRNISMIILLPKQKKGLPALEASLNLEMLTIIRKKLKPEIVYVSLPKFEIQYSKEMSSDIQSFGAKDIFEVSAADFSGMTNNKNIKVNEVLHKAILKVTEEGSEASAATGIIESRMIHDIEIGPIFNADHPFIFAIINNLNNMVLFAGRVIKM